MDEIEVQNARVEIGTFNNTPFFKSRLDKIRNEHVLKQPFLPNNLRSHLLVIWIAINPVLLSTNYKITWRMRFQEDFQISVKLVEKIQINNLAKVRYLAAFDKVYLLE